MVLFSIRECLYAAIPLCDLPQNEKCEHVDASRGMLTADPTCVALASASAHFDGPTADGSSHTAHETNQGCSRAPKLAIHTSALWPQIYIILT